MDRIAHGLPPAIRQIVERNEQLETENRHLYDRIHELLSDVCALKAARCMFRQHCETKVRNHVSELVSPAKELRCKIERQREQIEVLRSRIVEKKSEAETAEQERAELLEVSEIRVDDIEKASRVESEATRACSSIARLMGSLLSLNSVECAEVGGDNNNDNDDVGEFVETPRNIGEAVGIVDEKLMVLRAGCTVAVRERDQGLIENAKLKRTVNDLTTRICATEMEKKATDDCNTRYEHEREQLAVAIAALRGALGEAKESLIAAEAEKRILKDEAVRLQIEVDTLTDPGNIEAYD